MARFPKKAACGLLAGALAALGVAALESSGLVARWEAPLADWRARLLARPSAATARVKLVLLDQESLEPRPGSRGEHRRTHGGAPLPEVRHHRRIQSHIR